MMVSKPDTLDLLSLPLDVQHLISTYLQLDARSILTLRLVCKRWSRSVGAWWSRYSCVSSNQDCLSITARFCALSRILPGINRLRLWTPVACDAFADSLTKASFTNVRQLNFGALGASSALLAICERLPQLRSLDISFNENITTELLHKVLKCVPVLQELNIAGMSQLSNAGLSVTLPLVSSSLTALDIAWCKNLSDDCLETIATLSCLRSLRLSSLSASASPKLLHLTKLMSLVLLRSIDTKWTPELRSKITASLPKCAISSMDDDSEIR